MNPAEYRVRTCLSSLPKTTPVTQVGELLDARQPNLLRADEVAGAGSESSRTTVRSAVEGNHPRCTCGPAVTQ
jgi:hypothetical protein